MSNQVGGTSLPPQAELDKRAEQSGAASMTDEQIKQIALSKMPNGGKIKMDNYTGPTEVIDLPSKGLVYPKDNPLSSGQVRMKYMTAREEDILTSETLLRDGTVIDKLLESMIVDPINLDDLIIGDKDWLMIAARVLGYGSEYKFTIKDPYSNNEQTETIDCTQIEFKEIDESIYNNENRFSYTLPKSGKNIEFQLMTTATEKKVDLELKKRKFKKDNIDHTLSIRTRHLILSIDGETDPIKIEKDFNQWIVLDLKAFRRHLAEIQPGPDLDYTIVSEKTGGEKQIKIPFGSEFFWGD